MQVSNGGAVWTAAVPEDGAFSVLARVCSLDGTGNAGAEVAPGEGVPLARADVSGVACKVFDLGTDRGNQDGTALTPDPTVTVSVNVFDALRTVGWGPDPDGYNFRHDLAGTTYAPTGGHWYRIEYKFTLTAGGVAWLNVVVKALPEQSS